MKVAFHAIDQYRMRIDGSVNIAEAKKEILKIIERGAEVVPAWRKSFKGERIFSAFNVVCVVRNGVVVTVMYQDDISKGIYGDKEYVLKDEE